MAQTSESDRDKIFEQVFGRKPQQHQEQHTQLPLIVDNRQVAELPAIIPDDAQAVKVAAQPLLDALKPMLVSAALEKLDQQKTPDGFLTLAGLKAAALASTFDESALVLVMTVPAELRTLRVIDIAGRTPPAGLGANVAPPATVSSYLNVRGGIDYVDTAATGTAPGLQPLNLAMESATNVMGNVLQGDLNYLESGGPRFQRGNVSVIHDDPDHAVRYQAGDLSYPVTGFQSFAPMGGITIARNFSLQPYRLVQPAGQQDFVLQQPSRVEVLVNGQPMQFLQLPAGRYSMQDFPFTQGTNNVQLRVTDSAGQVSVINAPFFFSTNLLQPGESEFAYSVGAPSSSANGLTNYDSRLPAFSGFHRIGVSDNLTLGLNVQGDGQQQLAGAEVSAATPVGSFRLDVAGSQGGPSSGSPMASSLQYSYYDPGQSVQSARGVQFSATYKGANFAPLGTATSAGTATTMLTAASPASVTVVTAPGAVLNPNKLNLGLGYIQALPYKITGGISGSYTVERDAPRASNVDLSFRRFITQQLSVNLDLSHSTGVASAGFAGLLTFTYQLGNSGQSLTTSYDTQQSAETVSWSYAPPVDVDNPAATLTASNSDQQRLVDGSVSYNTSRLETNLTHEQTYPVGDAASSRTGITSLQFGTALVFADGHFAIGRPVADSFAMVIPHPNLSDLTVGVNPIDNQNLAKADLFGPAVLSNLSSYRPNEVRVVVPDLPLGYDLGPDVFAVTPSFDSGAVIRVGQDAVVLLDGTALGVDGQPIQLADGLATPVGDKTAKPVEFFTNRTGRFRVQDMKPGSYTLTFPAYPNAAVRITIPAGTVGIYRVGTITVSNGSSQ
ncbi:MAG: fimbria/pilus outer membrane usher protein [Stellaceae bacterium]